jgi:hypothetical protein
MPRRAWASLHTMTLRASGWSSRGRRSMAGRMTSTCSRCSTGRWAGASPKLCLAPQPRSA